MLEPLPDVAIVVVAYNSGAVIDGLLDSLPAACGSLRTSIVVVDNGSSDDTVSRAESRGDCVVVRSTNIGYAAGINLGVAHSPAAPAILVLNPDLRLDPLCVAHLAAALDSTVGITVPKVVDQTGTLQLSLRREQSLLRACGLTATGRPVFSEYVAEPSAYEVRHDVTWALGAIMLIDRRCYEALDGWDESFFLYSEETDFCLRARDHGWTTRYQPEAVAMHIGGQSGQSGATYAMQIVNRVRLYHRRHGLAAGWIYFLLTVLGEASHIPRGGPWHRAAVVSLLRPKRRPSEIGCSSRLLPV